MAAIPGSVKWLPVFSSLVIRGSFLRIKLIFRVATVAVQIGAGCVAPIFAAQATNTTQAHERKAQEYVNQKQPKLAIPEFKAVLAADPNNLNALANLGVLLYFEQDYAEAAPYLKQAVAKRPDLSKIRALLGLAEKSLGKTAEARADLEASVPQLAEPAIRVQAGLALIEIYAATQELDKAAAVVTLLKQVAPTDPHVLYTAYRIYSALAGEAMLDLSVVAPESGQMHQAMAHELYRARDPEGTIANLRKAVAADPNLPGIHFELAEALRNSPTQSSEMRPNRSTSWRCSLTVMTRRPSASSETLRSIRTILMERPSFISRHWPLLRAMRTLRLDWRMCTRREVRLRRHYPCLRA